MKFLAIAAAAMLAAGSVCAQTAGTWMMRAGATQLAPVGPSGCMTAPDYGDGSGCSRSNVSADTQLAGGITYMYTDNISFDVPLALPFKHNVIGAGSLEGAGKLGEVKALPMTVFLQYRFLEANAKFRPYVTTAEAAAYIELIGREGTIHDDPPPAEEPLSADPDDEYLLDLARAAAADVLVSGDSHLLVLREVVPVMTPAQFLASLANR